MNVVVFRIGFAGAATAMVPSVADQAYGSTLAPGRWHNLRAGPNPRRLIYCAGSRALAQLEKRVHANGIAPVGQALFRLTLPDGLVVATAESLGLPSRWRRSETTSQTFGDQWLDSGVALALWVPSDVEPAEHDMIINAAHPGLAQVTLLTERDPFEFDPRLA